LFRYSGKSGPVMLKSYRLPLLIAFIFALEGIVYLWANWTTDDSNFVFAKCARNSGRASAALNLIILIMVGYYGLKKIYADHKEKDVFRILITLFAINHLVHFFYVYQNFKSISEPLVLSHHIHGIITFIFILLVPMLLWTSKNLSKVFYIVLIIHLFNTTYFMIDTFYGKIINDPRPAYLHQFGIAIMIAALLYILYRIFRENKQDSPVT
jgi:DMSO/TMAO reductase YedYZ heme-binding membrane subunit